jgi:GT2 family glycosyltransferase
MTVSVFACITSRDGRVPEDVREAADAACATAAAAGVESVRRTFRGPYGVALARNGAVAHFLRTKHTHLLFIDDDVTLPADAIVRLAGAAADPTRGVVMGCYPGVKVFGDGSCRVFVVVTRLKGGGHEDVYLDWPDGLVEVESGGAGCMLISRAVLEQIPYPWFRFQGQHVPGTAHVVTFGEDVDFCQRARALGYGVWADGGVRCGHKKEVDLRHFLGWTGGGGA